MANTELTASLVTNEALRVLDNHLVAAGRVTQEYQDHFDGPLVGEGPAIESDGDWEDREQPDASHFPHQGEGPFISRLDQPEPATFDHLKF